MAHWREYRGRGRRAKNRRKDTEFVCKDNVQNMKTENKRRQKKQMKKSDPKSRAKSRDRYDRSASRRSFSTVSDNHQGPAC